MIRYFLITVLGGITIASPTFAMNSYFDCYLALRDVSGEKSREPESFPVALSAGKGGPPSGILRVAGSGNGRNAIQYCAFPERGSLDKFLQPSVGLRLKDSSGAVLQEYLYAEKQALVNPLTAVEGSIPQGVSSVDVVCKDRLEIKTRLLVEADLKARITALLPSSVDMDLHKTAFAIGAGREAEAALLALQGVNPETERAEVKELLSKMLIQLRNYKNEPGVSDTIRKIEDELKKRGQGSYGIGALFGSLTDKDFPPELRANILRFQIYDKELRERIARAPMTLEKDIAALKVCQETPGIREVATAKLEEFQAATPARTYGPANGSTGTK